MKIAIVDFETTGLDPYNYAEIIEIGMVVVESDTGEIISKIDMKVKPNYPWLATDEAIKVNGYSDGDWQNAMSKERAISLMQAYATDAVFASWNVSFDWLFMAAFLRETKTKDFFPHRRLDVMSMAFQFMRKGHEMPKPFSLRNVCEHFGIEPEPEPHRALNGAMCAYNIFKKIQ